MGMGIGFGSERKLCGGEKREQRAGGVDVFESLAGLQGGGATGEDDVFGERRAVFEADACVGSDGVTNWRLEEEKFERFSALEAQEIYIGEGA